MRTNYKHEDNANVNMDVNLKRNNQSEHQMTNDVRKRKNYRSPAVK